MDGIGYAFAQVEQGMRVFIGLVGIGGCVAALVIMWARK